MGTADRDRRLRAGERSISPVIGVVLMVAIVVVLSALVSAALFGFGADEPAPTISVDTGFVATSEVDPHWQFTVTHASGGTVGADELLVRFVDAPRGNTAEVRYPEQFGSGDQFRAELWGDAGRVSGGSCLSGPEPGSSDQLAGFTNSGQHATAVDVLVIHEPSNTVLVDETVDLGAQPERWTGDERHYLVDGAVPSIDCPDEPNL